MDFATLEANLNAELVSVVAVLDLIVKYPTLVELLLPGAAEYIPFVTKLDAGLKAFQAELAK